MPDVVIVDRNGDEHHFPPGFDPHRAADIVKRKMGEGSNVQTQTNQTYRDSGPDTINGQDPDKPGMMSDIFSALGHAAQPESMGDFLSLIIPSASGIGGVRSGPTLPQKAGPIAGSIIGGAGSLLRKGGEMMKGPSRYGAAIDLAGRGSIPEAIGTAAAPYAATGAGRILEGVGGFLKRPEPMFKMEMPNVKLGEIVDPFAPKGGAMEGEFYEAASAPKMPKGIPPAQPKGLPTGQYEAGPSSLEDKLGSMSDDVVNYTNPDAQPALVEEAAGTTSPPTSAQQPTDPTATGGDPAESAIMDAAGRGDLPGSQPLGKPRVLSWKSGQGPSDELVQSTREQEGSKGAARRLGLSQSQVKARTSSTGALPAEAQSRITTALEGMSPEEKLTYLQSAPNGVSAEFIKSILGQ